MSLIGLLLVLIVIGVCLYLIENYIPMSPPIKTVIRVVIVVVLVVWLLQIFGVVGPTVPRLR
jgi:O-antigen ligase